MSQLKTAKLIIDLQFGSTGKGALAGFLATRDKPDTLITAWAANAGHTYIAANGRKFIHTMLANGVVSPNLRQILIGPGSLINPDALWAEIQGCADLLFDEDANLKVKLLIHPHAAVITQKHIDEEQGPMTKIGSTKKGVGAAAIDRIRRNPDDNNVASSALQHHLLGKFVGTVSDYNAAMDAAEVVQIEGAQGYSLSMYHGMYPYTTSRDVTTAQIFADCGIPMSWWRRTEVIGTIRTFPIRVANRFDDAGLQVGYSGGCYSDQQEIQWSELGLQPELTTVTKLPRRIFSLSKSQLAEAIRQCSTDKLFINFMNYCRSVDEVRSTVALIYDAMVEAGMPTQSGIYFGFGPGDTDILEMDDDTAPEVLFDAWQRTAICNQ